MLIDNDQDFAYCLILKIGGNIMKSVIINACLNSIMSETAAKRIALVQNFSEMQLAALLGGVAERIISFDKELLLKKLNNDSIKEIKRVYLNVEQQRVSVYYSVLRYAKEANETSYYKTNSQQDDKYCFEVYPTDYTSFDVDEVLAEVKFDFV